MTTNYTPTDSRLIEEVLEREMTSFFTHMLTPQPTWNGVTNDQLIDALASALINFGNQSGRGIAMLQTLAVELQERINKKVTG